MISSQVSVIRRHRRSVGDVQEVSSLMTSHCQQGRAQKERGGVQLIHREAGPSLPPAMVTVAEWTSPSCIGVVGTALSGPPRLPRPAALRLSGSPEGGHLLPPAGTSFVVGCHVMGVGGSDSRVRRGTCGACLGSPVTPLPRSSSPRPEVRTGGWRDRPVAPADARVALGWRQSRSRP